jgi:N-acetylmuramoyl-L-alanine amidase
MTGEQHRIVAAPDAEPYQGVHMKSRTISLAAALLLLVAAASAAVPTSLAAGPLDGVIVCLDPGHGGSDPGAMNELYNLRESAINLDVSFALKSLLEARDATVAMTRTDDDTYLTNADRYTFCKGQLATVLVSVHTNSVTDPTWDGSMTLYAPNRSPALAQAIQDKMYPFLLDQAPVPEAFRDWGLDHFASGVLFKCDMPAAMVEPLFMSHPAEAGLLQQTVYDNPLDGVLSAGCAGFSCRRGQIAQAVLMGLLNYFDLQPPPTPEPGGTLHVGAIEMEYTRQGANYLVHTRVTVHDGDGAPVPGASVALTTAEPDGTISNFTGITGDDGAVVFSVRSKITGLYESAVTAVSKEGWQYDPASNISSEAQLLVP